MTTETHQVDFAIDDLADLHEVLADYAQRKGPVFEILFGGRPIWLVLYPVSTSWTRLAI